MTMLPRVTLAAFAALTAFWGFAAPSANADEKKPHVVFVTGDDEYRSEITMPMIAEILEKRHGMRCSVAYAFDPDANARNPKYKSNIVGLEALKDADLAVIFVRFRALPPEQFEMIREYAESGRPLVGLRTTTHAFLYPQENSLAEWNDQFGIRVFGQKWITHHGHTSSTDVTILPEQANNPILRGVAPRFHCTSWLYHVAPLVGDCTPLLQGETVNSEKDAEQQKQFPPVQPVAWTKTHNDARVFFTTLGHPSDFEQESMRKLLVNGIFWSLGKDVPEGGADAEPVSEYIAPPTH